MWRQRISAPSDWRGPDDRTRVLIEHHDPNVGGALGNLLLAEGYAVATCHGPDDRRACPLAAGQPCGRVAEADVIIFGLEVEDELDREVLAGLRAMAPETPVVVEIPPARVPLYRAELADCVTVPRPMSRDNVLEAIERAQRRRGGSHSYLRRSRSSSRAASAAASVRRTNPSLASTLDT